ncbi:FecR family protein [Candidatus Gracilibacteria bacterium]|nr:FecR family protein [Candidatus Gracilibacteria bacterium]
MRRRSNYRRSSLVGRRRRRNVIPLLTVALAFVLLMWIGGRFLGRLFSDTRSEVAAASIQIQKGRTEFSLPENEQWTPAYSDQEFLSGDSVRTSGNSHASLEFLGGNVVFLDQNTEVVLQEIEESSSGEKTAHLKLVQGRLWARVSEDDFGNNADSVFTVETPRTLVHVRGTIFDLSTNAGQDTIRLIKGGVDTDIFIDEKKDDFLNIKIGVGQKLAITPQNIERLKNKEDVLEIMDTEFIESEWHLQNLERFFPQEATQIRRRIEMSAPKTEDTNTPTLETSTDIESPQVISPQTGTRIPSSQDAIQIEGTAPLEAVQIIVNGYTLTRFQPGDRKWTYFAAAKFGTLIPGENKFSVVAISRDGKKSPPTEFNLFYEREGAPAQASGSEPPQTEESSIDGFAKPVITKPSVLNANDAYQTSSDVVTIAGTVDPKTNTVEVSGFRLKKFQPGQTEFSYIANARYGNMKEGENIYEVVAFGPDGKKASSTIKVVYTPLNVSQ